jgi:hypothetical protein
MTNDLVYPGKTPSGTIGVGLLPAKYNLELYRGDYFPLRFVFTDPQSNPLNLAGYTAASSIRSTYDAVQSFDFTVTVNSAGGYVDCVLPGSVSASIPIGDYIWDFQVTDTGGNTRTYMTGDVTLYGDVTS